LDSDYFDVRYGLKYLWLWRKAERGIPFHRGSRSSRRSYRYPPV